MAKLNSLIQSQQWISVRDAVPTHIYSVVVWVVRGRLVIGPDDRGYLDVGSYFPESNEWKTYKNSEEGDEVVEVSHWMQLDNPNGEDGDGFDQITEEQWDSAVEEAEKIQGLPRIGDGNG